MHLLEELEFTVFNTVFYRFFIVQKTGTSAFLKLSLHQSNEVRRTTLSCGCPSPAVYVIGLRF